MNKEETLSYIHNLLAVVLLSTTTNLDTKLASKSLDKVNLVVRVYQRSLRPQ